MILNGLHPLLVWTGKDRLFVVTTNFNLRLLFNASKRSFSLYDAYNKQSLSNKDQGNIIEEEINYF